MAGIYIHIPYCKEACSYCDFHFSIQLKDKSVMVDALMKELRLRNNELKDTPVETIYFGGGTPSLLSIIELQKILDQIFKEYKIGENPEITIEANPDDLIRSYTSELSSIGINRVSIGVQSWFDEDLIKLNRKHSASQAENAIINVIESGISNVSIDLIYGLPDMNSDKWKHNLQKAFSFNIQHLSAYHLTYEEGTVLEYMRKKKKIRAVEEEESVAEFYALVQEAEYHGFKQYELSNFSREGYESRHNSSYWNRINYLGIGPSAHSFIGKTRSWNISNNRKYVEGILAGTSVSEIEVLSPADEFNEYLMTGFRTRKGVDLNYLEKHFGKVNLEDFNRNIKKLIIDQLAEDFEGRIRLTMKGMFLSDRIISDMMII
jgi:oxygen-independent coproporphyrinogen III oxidase